MIPPGQMLIGIVLSGGGGGCYWGCMACVPRAVCYPLPVLPGVTGPSGHPEGSSSEDPEPGCDLARSGSRFVAQRTPLLLRGGCFFPRKSHPPLLLEVQRKKRRKQISPSHPLPPPPSLHSVSVPLASCPLHVSLSASVSCSLPPRLFLSLFLPLCLYLPLLPPHPPGGAGGGAVLGLCPTSGT